VLLSRLHMIAGDGRLNRAKALKVVLISFSLQNTIISLNPQHFGLVASRIAASLRLSMMHVLSL